MNLFFSILRAGKINARHDLVTATGQQIEGIEEYAGNYISSCCLAFLSPILILIPVLLFDSCSAIVFLSTAPLIPLFMYLIGTKARQMTEKQWNVLNRLGSCFLDTLQGLTTLKLSGKSIERGRKISEMTEEFRLSTMKTLKVAFVSSLTIELISTLSIAVAAVWIGLRLLFGTIDYFSAIATLILAPEFYAPLRNLAARFHSGMEGRNALKKAKEIQKNFSSPAGDFALKSQFPLQIFPIEFERVTYSYGKGAFSLPELSMCIDEGRSIAIRGKSGSGKTTLIKMLMGLIDPSSGHIFFNRQKLSLEQRTPIFSWVPQNPYIFNGSIRANILMGLQNASETQVLNAIKLSCLERFVSSLKNGLNTIVGERGMTLSAGQVQRIAIARAVLKDSPLLVLDEATSSIDIICEEELVMNLKKLADRKTVIFSAHRPSIIKHADTIIDLDTL